MMLEGLEIVRHQIISESPIVGKSIADAKICSRIGCTIIGIEENGKTTTGIDPTITIREGMTLAIIGIASRFLSSRKSLRGFSGFTGFGDPTL